MNTQEKITKIKKFISIVPFSGVISQVDYFYSTNKIWITLEPDDCEIEFETEIDEKSLKTENDIKNFVLKAFDYCMRFFLFDGVYNAKSK